MKHLHLITGLLIGVALAGCGHYGDDGAVNSTGSNNDTGTDSTNFVLAVAEPTFGPSGIGSKPRLHAESKASARVAHAVTGSNAVTSLVADNVRAFVIVSDSASASGYREVSIDVVEFENLGNGRYRIAIDGQAQVDGFFEITINGIVFKVPLSRTGTTDSPIDVNALQSALTDRLQALLVAKDVCSAIDAAALDGIFTAGRSYINDLTVPDEIGDVGALIEFYRVSVSSYIQELVTEKCAPTLNNSAARALAGDYHALDSGFSAAYELANVPALQIFSTQTATKTLSFPEADPALPPNAIFSGNVTLDNRFRSTIHDGVNGVSSTFDDLSTQNPERVPVTYNVSFVAFANDANRVVAKNAETVKVVPLDGTPFVPGLLVTRTPAWSQYAYDSNLFGTSQQNQRVFDLTSASDACLAAVGLKREALDDIEAFFLQSQTIIDDQGDDVVADALAANCGAGEGVGYGSSLHVDSLHATNFGITEMTGRFAVVTLEPSLLAGDSASTTGIGGFSTDMVFDIDTEGVLVAAPSATNPFSLESGLVAGGNNLFKGKEQAGAEEDDLVRIDVPLNNAQNPSTNGELFLEITNGKKVDTYSGFASAARDLFAFGLGSVEEARSNGSSTGGLFMVSAVTGFTAANLVTQGNFVYAAGNSGLQIVDISNPDVPVAAGAYTPANQPLVQGVAVGGNYAYLSLGSYGLDIVNIQNPKAPSRVAVLGSPSISNIGLVQVSGNVVYGTESVSLASSTSSILRAIDVSTPSAPALIGSFDLSTLNAGAAEYVSDLAVVGNRLYVLSYTQSDFINRLRIFDVSVTQGTATLTLQGTLALGNTGTRDIKVNGNQVYIGLSSSVAIYDVSNPEDITSLGSLDVGSFNDANSLWVSGNTVYVVTTTEGPSHLLMFDVTTPDAATLLGDVQFDYSIDIVGSGDHLFIASDAHNGGLYSVNVASAPAQTQIGSAPLDFGLQDIAVAGTNLYAVGDGFQIYDITNPLQPQATGSLAVANTTKGITTSGNRAYLANNVLGLVVVDITNPQQPVELTGLTLTTSASDIAVSGNYAYVTDNGAGLHIVDISGATPALAQTVRVNNANAVAIAGNYAFVADGDGLEAVNLTTIGQAFSEAGVNGVLQGQDVVISGNYAFVVDGSNGGVAVVDISDPKAMSVVARTVNWTTPERLVLAGTTLYAVDSADISIIDITNPTRPISIGHIGRGSAGSVGVAVSGSYLFDASFNPNTEAYSLVTHSLVGALISKQASAGLALGVRIDGNPPVATDLVGKQFTLTGQQVGQAIINNIASGGLGVIAGGNLRFVQVGADVLPVFDLPLSSIVVADFSTLTPRLSVQFDQWTPTAVTVDANSRLTFSATDAATGTTARFAAYLGDNGLLVGRFDALTVAPGQLPVTVPKGKGTEIEYPALTRAAEGIFVGVPRVLP